LALFVNFFNYDVDSFDRLTPRQGQLVLEQRREIEDNKYVYFDHQFRLINFHTIKSSFSDTRRIRKPQDLYALPHDVDHYPEVVDQLIQNDKPLTEMERGIIESL
jgi:hypothetical protein